MRGRLSVEVKRPAEMFVDELRVDFPFRIDPAQGLVVDSRC